MTNLYKSILSGPPSKEKRGETYFEIIVPGELLKAEAAYEAGCHDRSRVIQIRLDGGNCIHCNVAWRPVVVDNIFAEFRYFEPSCTCYIQCWHCGHRMIEEAEDAKDRPEYCTNCRVFLWGKRDMDSWKREDKLNQEAKENDDG